MNLSFAFPLILFLLTVSSGLCYLSVVILKDKLQWGWVKWYSDFFFVLLFVFLFRSFLFEPFRIPSSSMVPTLLVGDFVLVNKFQYGIRLPIINKKILSIHQPKRGDILVFRYPLDPSLNYIKRVVGLPGDELVYRNKILYINNKPLRQVYKKDYWSESEQTFKKEYIEYLDDQYGYKILSDPSIAFSLPTSAHVPNNYPCTLSGATMTCRIPENNYFVMGDNRDNSADSRYWGFVSDDAIVGKAILIWLHLGSVIPPADFRFDRIGFMDYTK